MMLIEQFRKAFPYPFAASNRGPCNLNSITASRQRNRSLPLLYPVPYLSFIRCSSVAINVLGGNSAGERLSDR